jgi:hypothetical protein
MWSFQSHGVFDSDGANAKKNILGLVPHRFQEIRGRVGNRLARCFEVAGECFKQALGRQVRRADCRLQAFDPGAPGALNQRVKERGPEALSAKRRLDVELPDEQRWEARGWPIATDEADQVSLDLRHQ